MDSTMQAPPRLLYPSLVIAAISVSLFSLLGIATLTGYLPVAHSTPQEHLADQVVTARDGIAPPTATPISTAPLQAAGSTNAITCARCGTVESISTVEHKGEGSGAGAVAGGLTGLLLGNQVGRGNGRTGMTVLGGAGGAYLGNRIEQNMNRTTSYRIKVRMDDGRSRTLYQRTVPDVAVGRQVEIVGSSVVPRS